MLVLLLVLLRLLVLLPLCQQLRPKARLQPVAEHLMDEGQRPPIVVEEIVAAPEGPWALQKRFQSRAVAVINLAGAGSIFGDWEFRD